MTKTCSDFTHIKNDRTEFGCCDSCHDDADGGWAELPEIEYLSKGKYILYARVCCVYMKIAQEEADKLND